MPWNEPGGNKKDPWSGNRGDQGPPDLDELLRKLSGGIGRIFGGGRSGGSSGGSASGIVLILVVLVGLWFASGFYVVSEGERGVVQRFGAHTELTLPGLRWHLPYPIEKTTIVDVQNVRNAQHAGSMLTQDENIVDIEIMVQYRVKDPVAYLFNVANPDAPEFAASTGTLGQVMESALREVVGRNDMDFILLEGREAIAADTQTLMQETVDSYGAGLDVVKVNLQRAQAPQAVQGAFADAVRAREDEARFRNEAEAYANTVIPEARGQAARLVEEAAGYRDQVIARSEGEAERFEKLLAEYRKAPDVTRERLYLDTIQEVMSRSSKVMVDVEGGNNLLYLPLDKIMQGRSGQGAPVNPAPVSMPSSGSSSSQTDDPRSGLRSREVR
ncbi:MAG: FtsH protease activity modulator HflK [Chromatiales bacterium]|nr:FtsH protease activity modulator HflK [Chromatiales bacterium]